MARDLIRVGRLSLSKSLPYHAEAIADDLRLHDLRECLIYGLRPLEALTEPLAIHGAKTYTIKFDESPIAMCGSVPIDQSSARIWMLGTNSITNNFRPFLRGCADAIELLHSDYEYIENYVPADHHETIMWLSWCGFTFDDVTYDICGHTMMRLVRCREKHKGVIAELTRPVMH